MQEAQFPGYRPAAMYSAWLRASPFDSAASPRRRERTRKRQDGKAREAKFPVGGLRESVLCMTTLRCATRCSSVWAGLVAQGREGGS